VIYKLGEISMSTVRLWDFILEISGNGWDSIEEVIPDKIDLEMIAEIQNDPDCQSFE